MDQNIADTLAENHILFDQLNLMKYIFDKQEYKYTDRASFLMECSKRLEFLNGIDDVFIGDNVNFKKTLDKAIEVTSGPREDSYGNKIKNHCNIASLWSAYLGREITARDVSLMMCLLKIARTKLGPHSDDHYVDGAGYMAIAGEISEDNKEDKQLDLFRDHS